MIKKKILFTIVALLFTFFIIFILNNYIIKPFEGFDKESILSYDENNKAGLEKRYYDFYNNYIDVNKYNKKYKIDFFYKHGKNMIFSSLNTDRFHHCVDSFSYIIYCDNYEEELNNIFTNYTFIDTPINVNLNKFFIDEIKMEGWIFKELYYNINMNKTSYLESTYRRNIRSRSYWFSYNNEKNILVFSIMVLSPIIYMFESVNELEIYLKQNLFM